MCNNFLHNESQIATVRHSEIVSHDESVVANKAFQNEGVWGIDIVDCVQQHWHRNGRNPATMLL
jgi:hypothetical protein